MTKWQLQSHCLRQYSTVGRESRKDCITPLGKDRKVVRQHHLGLKLIKPWKRKTFEMYSYKHTRTQIIQRLSHAYTHIYTLKRLYSTWVAWQRWQGAYQLEPSESNGTRARKRQDERKKKGRERVSSRKWETQCDRQGGCVWKKRESLELPTTALKGESSLMHTTDKMKPWQQRMQIHLV